MLATVGSCIGNAVFRVPVVATLSNAYQTFHHGIRLDGARAKEAAGQTLKEANHDIIWASAIVLVAALARIHPQAPGALRFLQKPIDMLHQGWQKLVTNFGLVRISSGIRPDWKIMIGQGLDLLHWASDSKQKLAIAGGALAGSSVLALFGSCCCSGLKRREGENDLRKLDIALRELNGIKLVSVDTGEDVATDARFA